MNRSPGQSLCLKEFRLWPNYGFFVKYFISLQYFHMRTHRSINLILNRFCDVNLGIFLFQHFLDLIELVEQQRQVKTIDEVKCSFALIVLGFYVYAKFFPIFQYHLNSFCSAMYRLKSAARLRDYVGTVKFRM